MPAWGRTDDGTGSEPDDAQCSGRVAGDSDFICVRTVAGSCAGCGRRDLSAAGVEDDCDCAVCDLDSFVCGAGGAAAGSCVFRECERECCRTCCAAAYRYALEFCDCGVVADGFAGARSQADDECGAA